MPGRFDRGARGGEKRFEGDAAPRRAPPTPSTPERRRKHVSALRAEIAADATTTRKRIERSATHDRKGRTIAVERMSRAVEEARTPTAPETRPKRSARPNTGERGGRSFEGGARAGRSEFFGPKRGRAAAGSERPPRSDHKEPGRRPERSSAGRTEGGPRERRFDRPPARSDGDRRDGPPRARSAGDPARERKFDRPPGRSRPPAGEGRPPRSDDRRAAPTSAPPDFKSETRSVARTRARGGRRATGRPSRRSAGQRGRPRDRTQARPRERRFDRPEAKRDGDRRERPAVDAGRRRSRARAQV